MHLGSSRTEAGAGDHDSESVLLLGNYRPSLTLARSLHAHGYRVIVGTGGGGGEHGAEYSRCVEDRWDDPPLDSSSERSARQYVSALRAELDRRSDVSIVYPVGEEFVKVLAARRAELPKRTLLVGPTPAVVAACTRKPLLLDLVTQLGLPCLPFRTVHVYEDLLPVADALGYPLAIRPLTHLVRLGNRKALICHDRDDLRRRLPGWPERQSGLLLQRYAVGERRDVFFAAQNGEALRMLEVMYHRTDHIEGTGLCVDGEASALTAELADHTTTLLRALDYTGIGCAQFVYGGSDGDTCFIELNPRISAIHRLPEAMGMELGLLAIALARQSIPARLRGEFTYAPGTRFAWTYGDLRGLKDALIDREIGPLGAVSWLRQTFGSIFHADIHLTWQWRDPLPTLMIFVGQLPGLRRRPDT